jgi:putative Mn2+ efflux pump MntP
VLRLLLVAAALGLSNFAASIGIGLTGVDASLRLRIAVVFGAFETAMPIVGVLIGDRVAHAVGPASDWVGGGLLVVVGGYTLVQSQRQGGKSYLSRSSLALIATGAALSLDNLVIGFALGTQHASLLVTVVVIGAVSVGMSLAGLELGDRLGSSVERRSQELGGMVLIAVGIVMAGGIF